MRSTPAPQHAIRLRACVALLGTLALATLGAAATSPAHADDHFNKQVRPLLEQYCTKCHNAEKRKGKLDLTATFDSDVPKHIKVWQKMYLPIREREMPPDDQKQVPEEQRHQLLAWLASVKQGNSKDCSELATDDSKNFYRGFVMSRRLNRVEYDYTVRDLLGLDHDLGVGQRLFPKDGSGGLGFDNVGDALFTSPVLMEKYLQAADDVLTIALPDGGKPSGAAPSYAPRLTDAQLAAVRKRVFVAWPGYGRAPRAAARQVIRTFIDRAYRRPAADADVDRLLTMFDRAQHRGDSYEASVKLALKAALISPHFLFLVEPEPDKEGVYELGDHAIAARLSYFLWSSLPDDDLRALADAGKLRDKDVRARQVRRMLDDPKAIALAENFGLQWLALRDLGGERRPDAKAFPEFNDELSDLLKREAVLFVDHVIREDRPLIELLQADYTYLNDKLASHYGIDGVAGDQMRLVKVTDGRRGGILGFGAVHAVTSYPLRTSPVLRGKWVFEDVLGRHVDPPPPNAGNLPEGESTKGLSFRQKLEVHRKRPECASCHNKMDPLGFGLENFDALGRWRDTYEGHPVDATGVLSNGQKFEGVAGLKKMLAEKQRDEFLRTFVRKMVSYGFGRDLTEFDNCVVDEAMKAMYADEMRAQTVVERIALSYPFTHRYAKK
ncbi:MAG: DUF1592 domain-containing protein [Phycisphaera sp.]|nr:DUF1592 domain-containing protein [Phycisphaera sp.]